ncbi:nuclease-related domain-containing protein [Nocardia sp. NPDC003979]
MRAVVAGEFGSGAERSAFRWLSELDGPVVVVFNVVAHKKKDMDPVQIDAVLWTSQRVAALEVKGLTEARGGALKATANGAWTLDGKPAPMYGLASHPNAFHQVQNEALSLQGALQWRLDRKEFVEGLVVVVPKTGHQVSVEVSEPLTGTRLVIAEDGAKLASAVSELSTGPKRWSASQVVAALRALNIAGDIDEAALLADGFPSEPESPTPTHKPQRRRPSPHVHRAGRLAPRRQVVHVASRVMTPPGANSTWEKADPAAVTASAAVVPVAAPPAPEVETPDTEASEEFDAWDLVVSDTDWEPSEPAADPDKDDAVPEQKSRWHRFRRPRRTTAPSSRRRKLRWYSPFWVLGWVIGWVWWRVRHVVEVVAIFVVGAALLGGLVYLAGTGQRCFGAAKNRARGGR